MFFSGTFLRNISHVAKISSYRNTYVLCNSKVFCALCQTKYPLLKLFSSAPRRTFITKCHSFRNCHSGVQGIDSQKTSNEQSTLSQATSCDKQKEVPEEKVKIYFETVKGEKIECLACLNKNVMNASIENDIAMHGNCNGETICSICHVYIDEKYQNFMSKISDDEYEMLDMVPNVQENSRLSCQIIVKKELEGAVFKLPHYSETSYDPNEN